jgi:ABC-2 type transport system ATP-binding protein
VAPTAGDVVFDGRPYRALKHPAHSIGAALDATSFHPGRTALGHLTMLAPQVGVSRARCLEVLELVGLAREANRRVGRYSQGMRGRLALAAALLGDPGTVLLDEPTNGLDPEGINWMRTLVRTMATEGRTVLISSHILGEVERTVDDLVIIARGRLVHASPLTELEHLAEPATLVAARDQAALAALIAHHAWRARPGPNGSFLVRGIQADGIGQAACQAGLALTQLTTQRAGLEQAFFELTQGAGLR